MSSENDITDKGNKKNAGLDPLKVLPLSINLRGGLPKRATVSPTLGIPTSNCRNR